MLENLELFALQYYGDQIFAVAPDPHSAACGRTLIRMELLPGGKSRRDQAGNWRISQATGRDVKDIQM